MFHKFRSQLPPFGLLAVGLTVVTLLTALSGLWHYQYELAHQSSPAGLLRIGTKPIRQATDKPTEAALSQGITGGTSSSASHQIVTNTTPGSSASAAGTDSAASLSAAGASQPAPVLLMLSINGQAKGTVSLPTGSNQCDVLTQALTDHLINALDMRYSSEYKTEAVYIIDGTGDPGAIWWTYKVNSTAPPYGCAYTKVHNGDSVNWQYVKSN